VNAHEALDRLMSRLLPTPAPALVLVPVCHCSGRCRCGGMVPSLLQLQIERDCEFFREVL